MKNLYVTWKSSTALRLSCLSVALALGAGCASTGVTPDPKAETSSAAIRAAEEVGGTHSPEAALHLQLAKEQFEYAKRLPNPSDRARADRLLMRAQSDAELSLALARSENEKNEAQGAIDQVKALKASAAQ